MLRRIVLLTAFALLLGVSPASGGRPDYVWRDTPTGTTAHFRGLSAVSATTAWVSGYTPTTGVVMRTTNGGASWQDVSPSGSAGLQFRDIQAFDASDAVAMSIGDNPTDFRMYVTHDGGQSWDLTFVNSEPNAFYDCMSFFDRNHGLAVSDPPAGVQVGLDLTKHADASGGLRDIAIAEPGESEDVEAARQRDRLDRARVKLRVETFLLEHPTSEGDGAQRGVETLHAMTALEQRDQVTPRAAPDHENAIVGLQKAVVQRLLPRHQAREDRGLAATERLPGVGDRSPQIVKSQRPRGQVHRGPPREGERPGGAPEDGEQSPAQRHAADDTAGSRA